MLKKFPSVQIPDDIFDPCFASVKEAFAKAYPSLPKNLYTPVDLVAQPAPKYVKELPMYAFPAYVAGGILWAPYRLPTSNFPMLVPFFYATAKLAIDQYPILLPFSQLTASQPKYGREYPIYLPFMSHRVKKNSDFACGSFIFLPFPAGKKTFFHYRLFRLDISDWQPEEKPDPAPAPEPIYKPVPVPVPVPVPEPIPVMPVPFASPEVAPLIPGGIPGPLTGFSSGFSAPATVFAANANILPAQGPVIGPGSYAPGAVLGAGKFDDFESYGSFSSAITSGFGDASFADFKPMSGFSFGGPLSVSASISGPSGGGYY
ncbi:uncharacterized protein LOC111121637 [Crassostrea virginica]